MRIHRQGSVMCIVALTVLAAAEVPGQSFRGEVINREVLSVESVVEQSISSGEVLLFTIPDAALRFMTGVELTVSTEDTNVAPGSYSTTIYAAVDPPQENGVQNLAGQRLATFPLTEPVRQRIFIPFGAADSGDQRGVTRAADPQIGDLAVQLVPIMKGMDSQALSTTYSVTITPRLRQIGAMRIELDGDEDLLRRTRAELTVTLNGEEIDEEAIIERAPGIYRLEAQAGDFLDTTTNIGIEQGRLREVVLEPQEPAATIRVSVPSVAEVYWNGARLVDYDAFTAAPGEHSIMIRLGDFTVSRNIELDAHESYELAIDLDILMKQN
ncbi:MAG: hypothetical protein R6U25_06530 [Alkalispirochaeta sp.]